MFNQVAGRLGDKLLDGCLMCILMNMYLCAVIAHFSVFDGLQAAAWLSLRILVHSGTNAGHVKSDGKYAL